MHFYSIHVIVENNIAGSEIICRQIYAIGGSKNWLSWPKKLPKYTK